MNNTVKWKKYFNRLRKGSFIYFMDPESILSWKGGYIQERKTTYVGNHTRYVSLKITQRRKPDNDAEIYLLDVFITPDNFTISSGSDNENKKNKRIVVFHSNIFMFYSYWLNYLKLKIIEFPTSPEDLKDRVDEFRELIETIRYCTQILQENKNYYPNEH